MKSLPDRILLVENDPVVIDLICRQTLQAVGYQTIVVSDSSNAISKITAEKPDVIIVNLSSAGLSGKDLLVALRAQDLQAPVIVLGQKGGEADVIQAFRLGAEDYLLWPLREAEIINVVERVLKQVQNARERERLSKKLEQTNQELQRSVQELTTIYSIGKAVTSLTDQTLLFERILDAARRITQAELGWLLLRNSTNNSFVMAAQQNLPLSLKSYVNHSWDDGISSLVAMSGESLIIHGEALKRFAIASLGKSALIVPVKSQQNVLGMLIMMRKSARPFTDRQQYLLEAVADYASISLVNAQLFRTLEERAETFQISSNRFESLQKVLYKLLQSTNQALGLFLKEVGIYQEEMDQESFQVGQPEEELFQGFGEGFKNLVRIKDTLDLLPDIDSPGSGNSLDLNLLLKETEELYRRILD